MNLDRGAFTAFLLDALATAAAAESFQVGDGEAPKNAGWTGEMNAPTSQFIPYLVLAGSPGTRSQGTFADSQDTWQLPYSLAGIGVQRVQADWIAQRGLDTLQALKKAKPQCGPNRWKIMDVQVTVLGAPTMRPGTEPPFWQRDDALSFYITKEGL